VRDFNSHKKEKEPAKIVIDQEQLNLSMKALNELTGLESVKKTVDKLISSLKVARLRKQRGLKVIPKNLNAVFIGKAGTGKSTVARIVSIIYKEMGILDIGHLIEVDSSGLVTGYMGQTATKTNEVINKSIGGTLFINDAYQLAHSISGAGQEAIETLLNRMDGGQDKFLVVISGDKEEMKEFLDSNPGIKSRFPNIFNFEDYNPRQLIEIASTICEKSGYKLDEGAWQLLLEVFAKLIKTENNNFGNIRTVKSILYTAISRQEERILTLNDPDDNDLTTITYEDVNSIEWVE
jgi:AAA+ superfamily predicted ATPase